MMQPLERGSRYLWLQRIALLTACVWLAAGCARPSSVALDANWTERGAATVYAASFAGRRTVSSEPYDPQKLTAAHATLPLGTVIEVTRDGAEARVVVRINDRPPREEPAMIVLSEFAGRQLALLPGDSARVVLRLPRSR